MSRYETAEWKELEAIQNMFPNQDILTITGFMNDEQLKAHLEDYRKRLENKR